MSSKKSCSMCKKEKIVTKFSRDSRSKDGLRSECKLCQCKVQLKSIKKRIKTLQQEGY